jgi:hypothetical protein
VNTFTNSNFYVKLTNWEYWPWYIFYIPVFGYWLWLGLRARTIFFFSAANPSMRYGGIMGASKKEIMDGIPSQYHPKTVLLDKNASTEDLEQRMSAAGLTYPIILKPDIGERGFKVALISNATESADYFQEAKTDVLVQEYLDLPLELGVFYHRQPNQQRGAITSVVIKEMLTVQGDGQQTLKELIQRKPRAKMQLKRLEAVFADKLFDIPEMNQQVLLEPIGNHNRGTAFLNGKHLINDQLVDVFDNISHQIDGFYYGRFDLRCQNVEALYSGDIKIMELNGAASEPAHIYSPNFPIMEGYKSLFSHWKLLYNISIANHKLGVPYMSIRSGLEAITKSRFT